MKLKHLALFVVVPTTLLSQIPAEQANSPASRMSTNDNRMSPPGQLVSLVGKVTSETNSAPSQPTAVVLECGGSERSRANTDRRGDFSISINVIENAPATSLLQSPRSLISDQEWNQCELFAETSGYSSDHIHLAGAAGLGVMQVGTIAMHPFARPGNSQSSIDVASLAAPEKAKKAFEKGQEQAKKGKWAAACDYFKRAVEVYPRYALAWMELGHSQMQQNDFSGAQQSFQKAAEQAPRSLDAYVQIAAIAAQQRQWKELADASDHLVQMAPNASPRYWFLNSAANLNLGNIPQAKSSATRGLRLDARHEIPQLQYLYGMIMARTGDYSSAIFHMKTYLELSPNAADSADARTKLMDLKKLAGAQNTARRVEPE